eukprot:3324828-Prymnesium_polylepis.1
MLFSPRTAHCCIPRCVYQRQLPRGRRRPCLCRCLKREYAACPLLIESERGQGRSPFRRTPTLCRTVSGMPRLLSSPRLAPVPHRERNDPGPPTRDPPSGARAWARGAGGRRELRDPRSDRRRREPGTTGHAVAAGTVRPRATDTAQGGGQVAATPPSKALRGGFPSLPFKSCPEPQLP